MLDWVKNHPYLSGSLVVGLIVMYIVLRNTGSSTPQVVQSGPSEALQAANLQAQTIQDQTQAAVNAQGSQLNAALAAKSIDAAIAAAQNQSQEKVALTQLGDQADVQKLSIQAQQDIANEQTNAILQKSQFDAITADKTVAGQIAIAQAGYAAQQSIATAQINGQVQIAGIQADVSKLAITDQLAALLDTNKTSIGLASIGAGRDVNLATINATLQSHLSDNNVALGTIIADDQLKQFQSQYSTAAIINQQNVSSADYLGKLNFDYLTHNSDNALALGLNNNLTTLNIAGINAGVQIHGQDVLSSIYNNLIDTTGQVQLSQINSNTNIFTDFLAKFSAVDFNRGGSGGANQVQVWSSIFGKATAPGSTSDPFADITKGLTALGPSLFQGFGL